MLNEMLVRRRQYKQNKQQQMGGKIVVCIWY